MSVSYSRQIRPPIYSMKQSKLRKRRVFRFAVLYYVLFVVFLALVVGPAVAGPRLDFDLADMLGEPAGMRLVQPNGQDRNNTNGTSATGTGMDGYSGVGLQQSSETGSRATDRIKLF